MRRVPSGAAPPLPRRLLRFRLPVSAYCYCTHRRANGCADSFPVCFSHLHANTQQCCHPPHYVTNVRAVFIDHRHSLRCAVRHALFHGSQCWSLRCVPTAARAPSASPSAPSAVPSLRSELRHQLRRHVRRPSSLHEPRRLLCRPPRLPQPPVLFPLFNQLLRRLLFLMQHVAPSAARLPSFLTPQPPVLWPVPSVVCSTNGIWQCNCCAVYYSFCNVTCSVT